MNIIEYYWIEYLIWATRMVDLSIFQLYNNLTRLKKFLENLLLNNLYSIDWSIRLIWFDRSNGFLLSFSRII